MCVHVLFCFVSNGQADPVEGFYSSSLERFNFQWVQTKHQSPGNHNKSMLPVFAPPNPDWLCGSLFETHTATSRVMFLARKP